MLPLDEPPEITNRRVRALARAEVEAAVAAGGAIAVALDGSLASGKVWPSSDLDLTVLHDGDADAGVGWSVRGGVVVHTHRHTRSALERLRKGYPASFVRTAAGDWVRDPTWLLDGLASLQPVHDPGGWLGDFRAFMADRRFRPEVVEPRRPLLLGYARRQAAGARAKFEAGDAGDQAAELAVEALAMIWLEAAGRIISHKELDPELAKACAAAGRPGAHALFRAAVGVDRLAPHPTALLASMRELLLAYSDWLAALLPAYPTGQPELDESLAGRVYARQRLWSALYAPAHGCLLHLASVRSDIHWLRLDALRAFAARWPGPTPGMGAYDAIAAARRRVLDRFPLPPWHERLRALGELAAITRRTFSVASDA